MKRSNGEWFRRKMLHSFLLSAALPRDTVLSYTGVRGDFSGVFVGYWRIVDKLNYQRRRWGRHNIDTTLQEWNERYTQLFQDCLQRILFYRCLLIEFSSLEFHFSPYSRRALPRCAITFTLVFFLSLFLSLFLCFLRLRGTLRTNRRTILSLMWIKGMWITRLGDKQSSTRTHHFEISFNTVVI